MLKNSIRQLANQIQETVVQNRRHLHAFPELSFKEFETAQFIKDSLGQMGIPWESMGNTGVVGMSNALSMGKKSIGLRADMDALAIQEKTNPPYKSQHPGIMHACGHDAHTASLLGTARILQSIQEDLAGSVKLIFQPGEEIWPGGAQTLIEAGVLSNPPVQAIIGQHVFPGIPAGKIGIRSGRQMASMDEISIEILGKGGHGAQPQQCIDPVPIAAQIVLALQQLVSRRTHPQTPSVLSIGNILADGSFNIIPDSVSMKGTFRTMDEKWRKQAHLEIKNMAMGIAKSMGASCNIDIKIGYPCLINDAALTNQVREWATEYLGAENIVESDLWMASEDFAYYGQQVPACFYLLGIGDPSNPTPPALHSADFDIQEEALEMSTGLMAYLAARFLS